MTRDAIIGAWSWRIAMGAGACALGMALGVAGLVRVGMGLAGAPAFVGVAATVTSGLVALGLDWWRRLGGRLTPTRVALWLEDRVPALQFALVSSLGDGEAARWCRARVQQVEIAGPSWRSLRRSLRWPAAVAVLGVAALLFTPGSARRPLRERVGNKTVIAETALSPLRARVVPPAYSRLQAFEVREPEVLQPLVGSTIEFHGPLGATIAPADITVAVDRVMQRVRPSAAGWMVSLVVDTGQRVVRLEQGAHGRIVTIEPRMDSIPGVTLAAPARDSVMLAATGSLSLRGRATDDLGLASAGFEYIVSSGEGERFTFRSGTVGVVSPGGRAHADLAASLDLSVLGLRPGDVVHLRAAARDLNTVSGAGSGASDTRALRLARDDEYDSVAVDPAAPAEAGQSLVSQRMLINLTEALVRHQRTLGSPVVTAESRRIARDQARLRKQVSDLVFARLGDEPSGEHFHGDGHDHAEGEPLRRNLTPRELLAAAERATDRSALAGEAERDETPIVAINRPLLEAYNAMWDAGRELEGGRPRAALPPMYVALAAIQRARAAERLYLRGTPPRVVVDVPRVRMQGKERGQDAASASRAVRAPALTDATTRLHRALGATPGGAAADSLLLVRLSLVGEFPAAARAMDALIADARAGRNATTSLGLVRRALDDGAVRRDAIGWWSVVWP